MHQSRFFLVFLFIFCTSNPQLFGQIFYDSGISVKGDLSSYLSEHNFELNSIWNVEVPKKFELDLDENTISGIGDSIMTRESGGEIAFGVVYWHKLSNSFSVKNDHVFPFRIGDCKMLAKKFDGENRILFRFEYNSTRLELFSPLDEEFRKLNNGADKGDVKISVKSLEAAFRNSNECKKFFENKCTLRLTRPPDSVKLEQERQRKRLDNKIEKMTRENDENPR